MLDLQSHRNKYLCRTFQKYTSLSRWSLDRTNHCTPCYPGLERRPRAIHQGRCHLEEKTIWCLKCKNSMNFTRTPTTKRTKIILGIFCSCSKLRSPEQDWKCWYLFKTAMMCVRKSHPKKLPNLKQKNLNKEKRQN